MAESVSRICRICLEQLDENVQFHLFKDNDSMLLSKFLDFLPEIDLDFVKNPISCNQCKLLVDRIHEFKKLCMQTETVIKDLKLLGKPFDDVISYVKTDTEIEMIKEEFKDEPEIVDDYCLKANTDLPVCVEVPSKHVNIHRHTGQKPYKCNVCNYQCNNKSHLGAHKCKRTQEKLYNCDVCDHLFKSKTNLIVHIRTHTGEKPYKCDVCDYSCNLQWVLKRHIRTHTGEKPYKCDVCEYCCNQPSNLKIHMRIHTGEKLYKCDLCDYSCAYKLSLKLHLKTHTGEKPYKCDICDYGCNQKSNLKNHMHIHSGEKPYKCDICEYRSCRKSCLKKHIQRHQKLTVRV